MWQDMNDTSYGDNYYDKKMYVCLHVCMCVSVRLYERMHVCPWGGGGGGDYESRRLGHKVFT